MKYITTPIYYINGSPHIGHLYTTIAADVYAKHHKQRGESVLLQTGTDEHGQKVLEKSVELKQDINEYVNSLAASWKDFWDRSGIEYDIFVRTTDEKHKSFVQNKLQYLFDIGLIYQGTYIGWYDKQEEKFWSDREIEDGLSPDGNPVERIEEKNYFFRLSNFQNQIKKHIEDNPNFIQPEARKNKVLSVLSESLEDLCISRPKHRLSWGIDLPFDDDYVAYVWFDALLNYISTVPEDHIEEAVHLIGKDILIFHTIYWPAMLLALGYKLPKTIFAHGWWLDVSKSKIGKSAGNASDPDYLIEKFGQDGLRYLLLKNTKFGADGKFSEERFITEYNSDLSNNIGNLINRTIGMLQKYTGGVIPESGGLEELAAEDIDFLASSIDCLTKYDYLWEQDKFLFKEILEVIQEFGDLGNKYIHTTEPWKLKDNPKRLNSVLFNLVEHIYNLAKLLQPFTPNKSAELLSCFENAELTAGTVLKPCSPLFPRIYDRG